MKNLSRRQWCIGALALLLLVYLLASGLAGTGLAALTQWLQQAQRLATGLLQRQLVALRSGGAAASAPPSSIRVSSSSRKSRMSAA